MIYATIFALFLVAVVLFTALWVPSRSAGLDVHPAYWELRRHWRLYCCVVIAVLAVLALRHFLLEGKLALAVSDGFVAAGFLLAFTPGMRRLARAMKQFVWRRR